MSKTIELAIGAALLSQALLALLWAGWASRWVVGLLFLATLAGWVWRGGWSRPAFRKSDVVFVPFGILYLIYALAPPTAPDAIGYHLGLASEWLRTGSLARRAVGYYDALPHGMETLFMAAAAVGGLTAATLLHFAFLIATLPLMIGVARRLGFDGRPAALLYFASPVVAAAGTAAYVDAALAFYALVTFWLLLEEDQPGRAGIAAGFCYAIKMSGGLVTIAAGAWLLARRSRRGLALAAAMVLPWLAYAWWLTRDPVAPLLLNLFPSPVFYPAEVAGWVDYVRSYGVPWRERWWEATLGGARAQGLLGPGFLLAPLALLSWRRQGNKAWLLVGAALVCGAGWFLNAGTRFLIPAAVFVALAVTAALPLRLAWGVALAQAILCWPAMLNYYAPTGAWRLLPVEWPWRAALRLEPQAEYLRRVKPDVLIAAMVRRHVAAGVRVLDYGEAPRAYAGGAELLAGWQYVAARRAIAAIQLANSVVRPRLYSLRGAWPRRRLRSLRLEQLDNAPDRWSIQELRLWRHGELLFPSRAWEIEAEPNPWDAPLVFDRNPVSAWRSWAPRRAGMFLEITGSIDVDQVELVCRRDEATPAVRVTGVDERGQAVILSARLEEGATASLPQLDLRGAAARYLRREGFEWILAYPGSVDDPAIGRALVDQASDWNLERVDEASGAVLLRIR